MVKPRTFFLNETHELPREKLPTGGSAPKLAQINWEARGKRIARSLHTVRAKYRQSPDPSAKHRYFLVALPEPALKKLSTAKGKVREYDEPVDYAGKHSWSFRRLGVDLIGLTRDKEALVHVTAERFDGLVRMVSRLQSLGPMEQGRWAPVRGFATVPRAERLDEAWLAKLPAKGCVDSVIELQPLLGSSEAEAVLGEIRKHLDPEAGEALKSTGTDFSGRIWVRGLLRRQTIVQIADNFHSVQAIHLPLTTPLALALSRKTERPGTKAKQAAPPQDPSKLPAVGVVDGGVPENHVILEDYRRGTFNHADGLGHWVDSHGSMVASRVVFGDVDMRDGTIEPPGGVCRFLDIRVPAFEPGHVDSKAVVSAIQNCVAAYPDVRVFNLSFSDHTPYERYPSVLRREKLNLTQDLDNLVFARDILVAVAAGNTDRGQVPKTPYPKNHEDQDWRMGHWAAGFNTLTCGSFTLWPRADALAKHEGAPSPFCKVGPGLAGAPSPELSEHGGNCDETHNFRPHLGVYVCDERGRWEDQSGTSFAVPLVAREAARLLAKLEMYSEPGSRPFAVTAKVFLALTSALPRPDLPPAFHDLVKLTLGKGRPNPSQLDRPRAEDAIFIWQGVLHDDRDQARVQLPVPIPWLKKASKPMLELCVAWDVPVNAAVENLYGCREVKVTLQPTPATRALHPKREQKKPPGYPLVSRTYDLQKALARPESLTDDLWLLELSYNIVADYYPGLDFSPEQRVAFAARIFDLAPESVSPQEAVQKLPIAETMVRLSRTPVPVRVPVLVRAQLGG